LTRLAANRGENLPQFLQPFATESADLVFRLTGLDGDLGIFLMLQVTQHQAFASGVREKLHGIDNLFEFFRVNEPFNRSRPATAGSCCIGSLVR
jgi:hypothetical protein